MVSKKSFTLLVDTGKIPIFTVFSIIFEQDIVGVYGQKVEIVRQIETLHSALQLPVTCVFLHQTSLPSRSRTEPLPDQFGELSS